MVVPDTDRCGVVTDEASQRFIEFLQQPSINQQIYQNIAAIEAKLSGRPRWLKSKEVPDGDSHD